MPNQFSIDEFRKYLSIEKSALDEAVIQQPSLLFEVSEACADAIAVRDQLKEDLAVIDAELFSQIKTKDLKLTEAGVKAAVQTDPKHKTASKSYIRAKKEADLLLALKEAFKDKSYALRLLCDLYVANYYEEGSVRGTSNTDTVQYQQRRGRLAAERERKGR